MSVGVAPVQQWHLNRHWRIGNSNPAPRFNVIAKPNDWSNRIKRVRSSADSSESEQRCLRYWTRLVDAMKSEGSTLQPKEPRPAHWLYVRSPVRGFTTGFQLYSKFIEFYFGTQTESRMAELRQVAARDQKAILQAAGVPLELIDKENGSAVWICAFLDCDPADEKDWPRQHQWLITTALKLHAALATKLEP